MKSEIEDTSEVSDEAEEHYHILGLTMEKSRRRGNRVLHSGGDLAPRKNAKKSSLERSLRMRPRRFYHSPLSKRSLERR